METVEPLRAWSRAANPPSGEGRQTCGVLLGFDHDRARRTAVGGFLSRSLQVLGNRIHFHVDRTSVVHCEHVGRHFFTNAASRAKRFINGSFHRILLRRNKTLHSIRRPHGARAGGDPASPIDATGDRPGKTERIHYTPVLSQAGDDVHSLGSRPASTSSPKRCLQFQLDQQPLGTPPLPPAAQGLHRPEFLPGHDPGALIVGRRPLGPSAR